MDEVGGECLGPRWCGVMVSPPWVKEPKVSVPWLIYSMVFGSQFLKALMTCLGTFSIFSPQSQVNTLTKLNIRTFRFLFFFFNFLSIITQTSIQFYHYVLSKQKKMVAFVPFILATSMWSNPTIHYVHSQAGKKALTMSPIEKCEVFFPFLF